MFWITYFKHYGTRHSPVDSDPNTYSKVAVFNNELDALRYANEHGAKCVPYTLGTPIDDASAPVDRRILS